jgi:GxxExxY protein
MPDHDPLTDRILGCAVKVSKALGQGFLEKVYEKALVHELEKDGLTVESQKGIEVWYDGIIVGQFVPDLLIEGKVVVEIKAVKALDDTHLAQGLNYLRSTGLQVCLLLNFGGPKLEIRRLVPGPTWMPVRAGEER